MRAAGPLLPWVALALVAGAAVPAALPGDPRWWWWGAGLPLALIAVLLLPRLPLAARGLLALAAFAAGAAAAPPPVPDPGPGPRLFAGGGVVSQVVWRGRGQGLLLEGVDDGAGYRPARLFVRAPGLPALEAGDRVAVRGRWEDGGRGPAVAAVDLARTQAREAGARGWAWSAAGRVAVHRELAEALLLGRGAPPEKPLFRRSGLLHLLAVSGAHLAIAAALGAWLLRAAGLGWWWRQLALAALLCGYAWLTDGSPATLRALVMALAVVAYGLLAREPHPLGALALAALALLAVDPGMARDLGFQLSLAAVLGLVTVGRELHRARERWLPLAAWPLDRPTWRALLWTARAAADGLALGCGATIAILPLLAWHFPAWSPWSPLTTLVAAPPTTAALWLGLPLLALAGWWPAGPWEGLYRALEWSLEALVAAVRWAAELPGASLAAAMPPWWAVLLWPLLLIPGGGWPWAACRLVLAMPLVASCLG